MYICDFQQCLNSIDMFLFLSLLFKKRNCYSISELFLSKGTVRHNGLKPLPTFFITPVDHLLRNNFITVKVDVLGRPVLNMGLLVSNIHNIGACLYKQK